MPVCGVALESTAPDLVAAHTTGTWAASNLGLCMTVALSDLACLSFLPPSSTLQVALEGELASKADALDKLSTQFNELQEETGATQVGSLGFVQPWSLAGWAALGWIEGQSQLVVHSLTC